MCGGQRVITVISGMRIALLLPSLLAILALCSCMLIVSIGKACTLEVASLELIHKIPSQEFNNLKRFVS